MKDKNLALAGIYLAATFLVTGACWLTLAFFHPFAYGTAPFMALYLGGGLAPTYVPFIVMGLLDRGGLKAFLGRLGKWRVHPLWYLAAIACAAAASAALVLVDRGGAFNLQPWYMAFPLFVAMVVGGGLEELGWRGYLLDKLLDKNWHPLLTALLIGVVWSAWHWPLFHIEGVGQYGKDFLVFGLGVVGLSLILTVLYAATRSILLAILFHAVTNTAYGLGFIASAGDTFGNLVTSLAWLAIGIVAMALWLTLRPRVEA